MNAHADTKSREVVSKPAGLALLREPFSPNQISKLPKPTKRQTEEVRQDFKKGIRCQQCGQWHHPQVQHLDYVGHAALTDRLLDCDPEWNWEPMAFSERGTPLLDENGGMWIKLTVCGHTRLGYGDAEGKKGGNAIKEVIGDALRNAAMRFGAALDLWHKGDLHGDVDPQDAPTEDRPQSDAPKGPSDAARRVCDDMLAAIKQHGAEVVTGSSKFKADFPRLEADAPDLAAKVQAAIDDAAQKPGENIDPEEIPY